MIIAATDGSSLGNPGAGGWCWYLSPECWRAGGFTRGTNNQAELMAVADLLTETAGIADDLLIQADSQYVINILTKWRFGWKKKGWKTGGGKPVANLEVVKRLDQLLSDPSRRGKVRFEWVKGHAGHPLNEQADSHAQAVARAYQSGTPSEKQLGPGWKSGKEGTSERTSHTPGEDAAKSAKYLHPEDSRETSGQQKPVAPAAAPARPLYPQLEQNPNPKEYRQGRYLIREHVLTVPLYHPEVALNLYPDSAKNPVVNLARGADEQDSGVQSELFAVTPGELARPKSQKNSNISDSDNQFLPPWVDAEIQKTNIQIYTREIARDDDENRPYLIFFQGGPGCKGSRPADWSSPWFGAALEKYRIIMLDQRGTGRSTPLDNVTIPALGSRAGAWLRLMRADQIVGDAEALRRALGIKKWTVMGQSFGGFIITAYLSRFPEAIEKAYITGGLPGLTKVNRIYERTFAATARRCREFYALPGMEEAVRQTCAHVLERDEYLPNGEKLTPNRIRQVGLELGRTYGLENLRYLFEAPFVQTGGKRHLTQEFLGQVGSRVSFALDPLYALLHETIYGNAVPQSEVEPTAWAADRIRANAPGFAQNADPLDWGKPYYLTGEHFGSWVFAQDPALKPLANLADDLAAETDWPVLYDPQKLAENQVPVHAVVYRDDIFVPRTLSLNTGRVMGANILEKPDWHHDGLRASGNLIISWLLSN
ncbi:alpha/beta fold hydrolase [Varibaculum massiliense]|uniref:alpha/beta fold hydrolase n=1 Tax=Varibaculum massiliense TaxID=1852372 RepID=UPI0009F604FA|nr:alpha/beta fold hydrolase [Varibaculum massiliense]